MGEVNTKRDSGYEGNFSAFRNFGRSPSLQFLNAEYFTS